MGDYNADPNYSYVQAAAIAHWEGLVPFDDLLFDQWSLDSANRVSSFHDGTGNVKVHVKFDPREVPS